MIKRFLPLIVLLLWFSPMTWAQKVLWDLSFDTRFDNHEFAQMSVGQSKTLFGLTLAPAIGFGWGEDDAHSLMVGGTLFRGFGDFITPYSCDLLAYYRLNNKHFSVYAGAYPQNDSYSDFSTAFISDDKRFEDRVLEGVKFTYKNDKGYVKLIFDWPYRDHEWKSEILTFYSSSLFRFKWFYLGYLFDMNHYALGISKGNVVDNIWINPFVGLSFADYIPLESFDFRFGWIQTFQKDRWTTREYIFPYGGIIDFTIQKWGVGLHNSLYIGQNLMPYYNSVNVYDDIYGAMLYHGDVMYSTETGLYNRLEAYWNAYSNNFLDVRASVVMHADKAGGIGWQQKVSLNVNLNNFSWKKMLDKKASKKIKDEKD